MRLRTGLAFAVLLTFLPSRLYAQGSAEWDQDVHYDMDVTLLADRHQMRGTQRLTYTNNSPDTLRHVFYHLYFNAFQPHSMMAERNRNLPDPDGRVVPRIFELQESEIGHHDVLSMTQDGVPIEYRVTDTVLRADLAEPLLPGETTRFVMRFRSQVPLQTRRSGRDNREGIDYSMTQWYPKMAMYDERGWHADPYIGREFYAPFGAFDVRITLPSDYVIAATGVLENAEEIGHGYGGTDAGPATDADSLTWHFRAEQVHDFAWSADPDYVHDVTRDAMGVTYHLLYQPDVAETWQYMTNWLPAIIQFYSSEYGQYPYPQMTVAQGGDGGMEYPMITLVTGRRSPGSLFGVTAHETAHMWFYAVLGSNEADYAWMDEGFTSYASAEARRLVTDHLNPSHRGSYLNVLRLHDLGLYEPMNTPSDWFTTNTAYGTAAYSAGNMLVTMMGYVIGEEQRQKWLREYFRRFTFRHPNPYDVEKVAEDVSGLRLDWFFQQFGYTTHLLDYAVGDVDSKPFGDGYRTTVVLERLDEIVMPVDVRLTLADGSERWVNVPLVVMQGHKPVPDDWIVAEPWPWTAPRYTLEIRTDQPVMGAEIDPEGLAPDRNRLNNTASFPLEARFLHPARQDWFHYSLGWRPLLQYADDWGFGGGLRAEGTYLFGDHQIAATLKLWPQVLFSGGDDPEIMRFVSDDECAVVPESYACDSPSTSFLDGFDYELSYARDLQPLGHRARVAVRAQKHLGILENRLALEVPLTSPLTDHDQNVEVGVTHQYAPTDRIFPADNSFPWVYRIGYPTLFADTHFLYASLTYTLRSGNDFVSLAADVGGSVGAVEEILYSTSSLSATRLMLTAQKGYEAGPLDGRATFQFGMGAQSLAPQRRFRLGAATLEERWRDDAFRSVAAVFDDPFDTAHLTAFGSAGPVAYRLSGLEDRPDEYLPMSGFPPSRSLVAGSVTSGLHPWRRVQWLRPLRIELFSGAATVWNEQRWFFGFDDGDNLGRIIADAGFGVSYDVGSLRPLRRWTAQSDVLSSLHVVAKFPLWASDPDLIDEEQDPFAFRWLLGIQVSR